MIERWPRCNYHRHPSSSRRELITSPLQHWDLFTFEDDPSSGCYNPTCQPHHIHHTHSHVIPAHLSKCQKKPRIESSNPQNNCLAPRYQSWEWAFMLKWGVTCRINMRCLFGYCNMIL